jgi:hypothetical protein
MMIDRCVTLARNLLAWFLRSILTAGRSPGRRGIYSPRRQRQTAYNATSVTGTTTLAAPLCQMKALAIPIARRTVRITNFGQSMLVTL